MCTAKKRTTVTPHRHRDRSGNTSYVNYDCYSGRNDGLSKEARTNGGRRRRRRQPHALCTAPWLGSHPEGFLWLTLAASAAVRTEASFSCCVALVHVLLRMIAFPSSGTVAIGRERSKRTQPLGPPYWRQPPAPSSLASPQPPEAATAEKQDDLDNDTNNNDDDNDVQGLWMSIVLVPTLLQAMSATAASASLSGSLNLYASLSSIMSAVLPWGEGEGWRRIQVLTVLVVAVGGASIFSLTVPIPTINSDEVLPGVAVRSLLYVVCCAAATLALPFLRPGAFRNVFTAGEWRVVVGLFSVAATEWIATVTTLKPTVTSSSSSSSPWQLSHLMVAAAGWVGCTLSCAVVGNMSSVGRCSNQQLVLTRVGLLVALPLVAVEASLWKSAGSSIKLSFPRSLHWLLHFLSVTPVEQPATTDVSSWWRLPRVPRYQWLLYWLLVVAIAIALAPSAQNDGSSKKREQVRAAKSVVVVQRKYFHAVACLLFGPVTMAAPRLQSLAYAIALCLLMVLECLRCREELPASVADFYRRYLDPSKDITGRPGSDADSYHSREAEKKNPTTTVIVSHMALIFGCAAPLWIAECCGVGFATVIMTDDGGETGESFDNPTAFHAVALLGVLVLGVGDAMGAIVGTYWGRHHVWPTSNKRNNRRTLEGSAAMLVSMAVASWTCLPSGSEGSGMSVLFNGLALALVVTTFLEAYTMQIDNIVLPLVGTAVLLLCL